MLTLDKMLYRESSHSVDRAYYAHKTSAKILMKRTPLSPLAFSIRMILRGHVQ